VTITHLDFGDTLRAHIFVSWLHAVKEHRLVVLGEERMAVFTDGPDCGSLRLFRADRREPASARDDGGEAVAFERTEPLRAELTHFLDCIRTGDEPKTGGRHGLEVLRILEAARRSLEKGGMPEVCAPLVEAVR
jgi:UDP-2-acetamido-3-amino-2,3-dideoxy-glucuronate N-acetyltransferase